MDYNLACVLITIISKYNPSTDTIMDNTNIVSFTIISR